MHNIRNLCATTLVPALTHTVVHNLKARCAVHDLDGRLLYVNPEFKGVLAAGAATVAEAIGDDMWEAWYLDARMVLRSRAVAQYVAQVGRTAEGYFVSDRCPTWDPETTTSIGMVYSQVLPLSVRRGIVGRMAFVLNDVLQYMPCEEHDLDCTIIQAQKGPR